MSGTRLPSVMLASTLAAGALAVIPAVAANADPTACPDAFPTSAAVDGVNGTGWTVERGTTPEPFSATVLGRITDGIAPGVDMIMAEVDSPALRQAGGVWAGMSGSPVYADNGDLIGAVAYGLAPSSPIAGITPASEMQKLLSATSTTTARSTVKVDARTAARLARTGEVTAAEAGAGFSQLKVPVSVSGATAARNNTKFLKRLKATAGVQVHTGGAAIRATAESSPSEITAGSNFTAALSYGDVSLAGTGTTTFVCRDEVVAFGHPLLAGMNKVQVTAHPSDAVYVQADPVYGPFKVANPGGPVGVVTRDMIAGIKGTLGATPTNPFPITSSLKVDGGAAVTGRTIGVYQPWAADIAAQHLYLNVVKATGADGGGVANLKYTIKGTRAGGKAFTLTRSNRVNSPDWISATAGDDLLTLIGELVYQDFEDVKITSVDVTGTISTTDLRYRVTAVKMLKDGEWVAHKGTINTKPGKTVTRQITLTKVKGTKKITTLLKVKIPAGTKGYTGTLGITDGLTAQGQGPTPKSFTALLKQLAAEPTNDSVVGTLNLSGAKDITTVTPKRVAGVVSDYSRDLNVAVK